MSTIYSINKSIGRSVVFQGIRAQYLAYMAVGLVGLIILFAVLYISGLNTYACVALALGLGSWLIWAVSRMSRKYGQYGLLKKRAQRQLPDYLYFNSRRFFTRLIKKNA